jgi:hypothetical protein
MTMNDDSNLQLLQRDLRNLAEPGEQDERLRIALRATLASAASPGPRRPRAIRLALVCAAVAATAAAIALVAIVGTTGSGAPATADAAIIHHALKAVTPPPNAILHVKVVGRQNGATVEGQTWQQTSPPYASRGVKGEPGRQGEFADDGTTSFEYNPDTNTIYERPDSSPPTFTDPVSQIRRELDTGRAQLAGTVVIGGASLYKIDLPNGLVGYFDGTNYRPRYLDDPQRDGTIVRLRVVAYEYLPMTKANRSLLSVAAQHPTARRVDATPPGEPGK